MSRQEEKKAEAEKLLTRVLEECLDEDLSFVPPERKLQEAMPFQNRLKKRWISC